MKKVSNSAVYLILAVLAFVFSGMAGDHANEGLKGALTLSGIILLIASAMNAKI